MAGAVTIRPPAVAGLFYPSGRRALEAAVQGYLDAVEAPAPGEHPPPPKALIVPHAGYVYSGPVAASAYATLRGAGERIERVVLLGPSHHLPFQGLAASSADAFETPLGAVALDRAAVERALALRQVALVDLAHADEHSLEVQLPFLQCVLGRFRLVPFAAGDATPEEVDELLELLWGDADTLVVVSSDLSHYHDYATARRLDTETTRAIEALRPEGIRRDSACGRVPVRGLLQAARRRGLSAHALDVRSSGDTAGSRGSVVGYGSYAFA